MLSAHRPQEAEDRLTVYWRGRTDAEALEDFFASTFPSAREVRASALFFTDADRIQLDFLPREELAKKRPHDVSFFRLECRARGEDTAQFDTIFIVWSRLRLELIPRGEPAPDNIGIYLGSAHLVEIRQRLADFIDRTHIYAPRMVDKDVANECLQLLAKRIFRTQPPPPPPLAAA